MDVEKGNYNKHAMFYKLSICSFCPVNMEIFARIFMAVNKQRLLEINNTLLMVPRLERLKY